MPVYAGMRSWRPARPGTLAEMRDRGHRRALGVILSTFQVEASWDRYIAAVSAARDAVGAGAPEVAYAGPWSTQPRFLDAMAARVSETLSHAGADAWLVFTAHSVPVSMARGAPYVGELEAAGREVAARLGHVHWCVAYQSRSGSPREAWLEPDIADRLRELAANGAHDV